MTFLREELIPFLEAKQIKIVEIVSDYRLPRPSESEAYCVPGTWGFESEIPLKLLAGPRWVKSMNSPAWTRVNAADPNEGAGEPYCASEQFSEWLAANIGTPEVCPDVTLIGLTLDCCVLATAQELYYHGYRAYYLIEAVDTYNGTVQEKEALFNTAFNVGTSHCVERAE